MVERKVPIIVQQPERVAREQLKPKDDSWGRMIFPFVDFIAWNDPTELAQAKREFE